MKKTDMKNYYNKYQIGGTISLIIFTTINICLFHFIDWYDKNHFISTLFITSLPSIIVIYFGYKECDRHKSNNVFDLLDCFVYICISVLLGFLILDYLQADLISYYFNGILILIFFISKLLKNVINNRLEKIYQIIFDFLATFAITIFLIYTIPNNYINLQNIVTAIMAAIYGGFITFTGVKLTIKNNNDQKKHEQLKIAIPYFDIVNHKISDYTNIKELFDMNLSKTKWANFFKQKIENLNNITSIDFAKIESIDFEYVGEKICKFIGIIIDDNLIKPCYNIIIHKGDIVNLTIDSTIYIKDHNSLKLVFYDIYNNAYACDLILAESNSYYSSNINDKNNTSSTINYHIYSIKYIGLPNKIEINNYETIKLNIAEN